MFQFPGYTFVKLCIHFTIHGVSHVSFLIRKSSDLWLCAPTRSLSQLIASFIGSWCQGIHHAPFVAWPSKVLYLQNWLSIIHKEYLFLALLYFIYINLCAIFKEHNFRYILQYYRKFFERLSLSKLNRKNNLLSNLWASLTQILELIVMSLQLSVTLILAKHHVGLDFSIERRWSSRRFSYGYLVTTSPQSLTLP